MEIEIETKRTYLGLRPGKFIFGIVAFVVIIVSGILSKQVFYEILISLFSVITILYIIEGKLIGCVFGIAFCAAYAVVCYSRELYGLMLFQICMGMPMYAVSVFTWKKNQNSQNKGTVAVKRLPLKKLGLIIGTAFIGYWGILALLTAINSSNAAIDGLTLAFGICGMILLSLRYVEQWYFNIASCASVMILWIIKSIEDISNLNFLIVAIIYVTSNTIGLISWLKMDKTNKIDKNI